MMNLKENYLALLNHEATDFTPCWLTDVDTVGTCTPKRELFEVGPAEGGFDGFGCKWIPTESAGGEPTVDPAVIVLDNVCDWEDKVRFPDLDAIDWAAFAEGQLAGINRDEKILEYNSPNSIFLRFSHLLGFENALISMLIEPDASTALMNAIADYKIAVVERVHKYFNPDAFLNYDDVATAHNLFMSPEVYRTMIKPHHKRVNDAIRALGMIPERHCCGYCTDIIEDFIDEGNAAWQSAQPSNDIANIIETYGDRLAVVGGYATQDKPASEDATDEEIVVEVDRCLNEYASYGRSYSFFGFFLGSPAVPEIGAKYGTMIGHFMEKRAA